MVYAKNVTKILKIIIFIKIFFVEDENEDEGIDEDNEEEEEENKAQEEYDDTGTLEETDETNEYEDEINERNDNFDVELEASMEIDNSAEEKDNDISEEFADIPGIHEIDDNSAEPLEEVCTFHFTFLFIIFVYYHLYI